MPRSRLSSNDFAAASAVELRARVGSFLRSKARGRNVLREVLNEIAQLGQSGVLFGGILRDLAIFSGSVIPRDVDIVVGADELQQILDRFAPWVRRRTRFGGAQIAVSGWRIDVWPISQTWAFRAGYVKYTGVDALPRTTFLNVEAAAIDLRLTKSRQRRLFTHGFFEGIGARLVDVNLEANPFPVLCVVRSLVTAARLDFALSADLLQYIDAHTREDSLNSLTLIQEDHYGRIRRNSMELARWIERIHRHVAAGQQKPMRLPPTTPVQLDLWSDLANNMADELLG